MYIQKAEIRNIRSIVDFEIEFKNPAGWHVLIGDNGAGKSTIIRSIALALVGQEESRGLRLDSDEWINKHSEHGEVNLNIISDNFVDKFRKPSFIPALPPDFPYIIISQINLNKGEFLNSTIKESLHTDHMEISLDHAVSGCFSVAYGPYRRFRGGSPEWEDVFKNPSFAKLAAHLSIFGEDVALTETRSWLKDLNYKSLEGSEENKRTLENITKLINSDDFLPHNAKLEQINSENVFFRDGNDAIISVNQMSDGYRSILSMTFELIRQLVRVYGSELVFKNIEKDKMFIDLPGIVLVDEIDAHLHPTWQTRIGQWFLKYFPKLQFIVTTHSPLVCRAAEWGSIWRLAAPGSDEKSGEVVGVDRERLIYGNILDAYGTEVFGEDVSISQDSIAKQEQLVKLSKKKMLDAISPAEEEKLNDLKKVFTTDAPIEL